VTTPPDFFTALGLTIERTTDDEAVVRMDTPANLMSPFGAVTGGAVAALLDTALAIAIAHRLDPSDRVATHNLNVTYVAFSRERRLECRARVVSLRRSVAVAQGDVLRADGTLVATALGTFGVRRAAAGG
jgi:uncharacterized protein (TIGR00369 family)